jgi:hypothetical protein
VHSGDGEILTGNRRKGVQPTVRDHDPYRRLRSLEDTAERARSCVLEVLEVGILGALHDQQRHLT